MADAPSGSAWPQYKLQTNIPVLGVVKYADYSVGRDWKDPESGKVKRLPDQLKLRGLWNEEGKPAAAASVYVGLAFIGELVAMGVLEQLKENDNLGNPRWNVISNRQIRVVRREQGKKKPVYLHWAGEPEGAPKGTPQAQPAAAARPAAPATAPKDTPREQRPAKLRTAGELEREAALQLYQSGKAARNRLGEFSTTFEACLQAADVIWQRYVELHYGKDKAIDDAVHLQLIEKIAVHFSIQMAQEKQHVIPRERLEELKRLAGVTTKPHREKPPMTAAPAAPVVDPTPSPLPPSERDPLDLDGFDEEMPDGDELPY